jgi:hypothetical protein
MWKDIYSSIELDFMIFVIKYDQSYLKVNSSKFNYTNPQFPEIEVNREAYIREFNQSLQELKVLINENEFQMCNVYIIVNEIQERDSMMNPGQSNRMDEVSQFNH